MTEEKSAETRKWLIKSENDLGSARRLMEGEVPYYDTAVYHCQQAAEKALKAFLTHHDSVFVRTHDLTELLDLCITIDASFKSYRDIAEELTPYAVLFRYPGDLLEPDPDEVEKALRDAQSLVGFVLGLLPEHVRPPGRG